MTSLNRLVVAILLLAALAAVSVSRADPPDKVSLRTIEGEIVSVGRFEGEGQLELVLAGLRPEGGGEETVQVLLAPQSVCDEIGFGVAEGDRVRVRIFADDVGPARAQKAMNLTQGTMVRLRTLHRRPLWSASGDWQGGAIGTGQRRHRHGWQSGKGATR